MKKVAAVLLIASGLTATAANAEIGFGVGASIVFGGANGVDIGLGPKFFTTNEEKKVAASAGVDYLFLSKAFRPNIGVSYLFKEDVYTDINVGYNLSEKGIDFGFGVGYTKTQKSKNSVINNYYNDPGNRSLHGAEQSLSA